MEKFGLMTEAEITKANQFDVPNVKYLNASPFGFERLDPIVLEASAVVL